MRARNLASTSLVMLGLAGSGLATASVPALAVEGHGLLASFNGADAPRGPFSSLYGVAADQSSGKLYVVDRGREVVDQFSAAGVYVAGSELVGPTAGCTTGCPITGPAVFDPTDVAVDSSDGAVYVIGRSSEVIDRFDAAGALIGQFNGSTIPAGLSGSEGTFAPRTGIAVDPSTHDVYVADETGVIDKFTATGVYVSQFAVAGATGIAVNSSGSTLYVAAGGNVQQFSSAGVPGAVIDSSGSAQGVAVDPATNDVYAADGSSIAEYDAAGALITQLFAGQELSTAGVAVDGSSGRVYESDNTGVVRIFGALAQFADVSTETPATNITTTTATVAGVVNPEGGLETQYHFEYGLDRSYASGVSATLSAGSSTLAPPGLAVSANLTGLESNATYHYQLLASNANGTNIGGDQTFTTPPVPPVIAGAASASDQTRTSVVLNGTVNPENSETTYHFVYVKSAEYDQNAANPYAAGGATAPMSAGSGFGDTLVTQLLASGLLPGESYHFALVAVNPTGTVMGPDATFTTASATPPLVETTGVANLSQNAASITGTIQAQGLQATYHFDVATDSNYGPPTGFVAVAASAQGPQAVASNLVNLQPATTYYYRVVATNQDGTTYGTTRSFTTPGYPALAAAPTAPPLIATLAIAFPLESGGSVVAPKTLTRAQKLAKALKGCAKKPRNQRAGCRKRARKSYGPVSRRKAKKT